jgi:chromosome partitioning protein
MRTWSFVNQKGGSGKSTLCTNLAVHAEEKGETVLIVDLDPQSSATLWHSQRGTNKPMVFEAIPDRLAEITQSAATLGVTLCLIDSPSKIDGTALAAIRIAELVICPTLPDLFNLGSLQDTVRLLEAAEKLKATVGVINNAPESGATAKVAEATAALASFNITTCPAMIHHRLQFQAAVEKGKGVTETGPRAAKAADEIRGLWAFLDRRSKQLASPEAGKAPVKGKTWEVRA